MAPKAFISHASEDKARFVNAFATRLRELGVEAWLDKWEMAPGDSLVDRIFEEGIKSADAFIVVLSETSVNKPWVREELNAGFVKRIDGKCKLIPVLIDDCDVPECLKSTFWERIDSLSNIEPHVIRIANAIHGLSDKPPIGPPPRHVSTAIDIFPQMMPQDHQLLVTACEKSLSIGWSSVGIDDLRPQLAEQGMVDEEILESLKVLENLHHITVEWAMGGGARYFDISKRTFEAYLKATNADYPLIVDEVCLKMLNEKKFSNESIQAASGHPKRIVDHVMRMLASQGLIQTNDALGGGIRVRELSVELKRHFRHRQ